MCRTLLLIIAICGGFRAVAQPVVPCDAPQAYPHYFRNPLRIPILLAGNFGECRPGHFHSGLDIKTGGHENEPVYAAADGYISRIKMEPGGFGHALYITHPNGYTTLYAHLNAFVPRLQRFLRAKQYGAESWTVDLKCTPDQFPVKQGEQVAWSGNTGGSTAPHLHFEIRDTRTEHPLNGALFGLPVHDGRAPVPTKLAFYNAGSSIYNQDPAVFTLRQKDGVYTTEADTIDAGGTSVIGVEANDFMEGSDNTLACYKISWTLDDAPLGFIVLDDIGYDETRYVNGYADYRTHQRSGHWIQLLTRLSGNKLDHIYCGLGSGNGRLNIPQTGAHELRVRLQDAAGNESTIRVWLRRGADVGKLLSCASDDAVFAAGQSKSYESSNCRFTIDGTELYDDVCRDVASYDMRGAISERFSVLTADVPAHHAFPLQLHARGALPFDQRGKVAMMWTDGKDTSGRAASGDAGGWYTANVRSFGNYWLAIDTDAPVIRPVRKITGKGASIAFHVKDKATSVKTFRGEIDGAWVLFEQHEDVWTYVFDGHCGKGAHTLRVTAADELGNESHASYTFTR